MDYQLETYKAMDQNGKTVLVSARTETDAKQQASEELGHGNVISFEEVCTVPTGDNE
ncbi:MAG: hypothetical protein V7739_08995 [Motiliproteus sp.]